MELLQLLHTQGVLPVPATGVLARQLRRAVADGTAVRALPGVAMDAALAGNPDAMIRAVRYWSPGAVITGRAALRIQGLPKLRMDAVDVLAPHSISGRDFIRVGRASLPGELVTWCREGPAATVAAACLFLGARADWAPVCLSLGETLVYPEEIAEARECLSGRHGSAVLDRVVRLTRENPWSVAELELHDLLRRLRIRGWCGNRRLVVPDAVTAGPGENFALDTAFEAERLDVEMNGREFHDTADAFESDARRIRAITRAGWNVMPVTPNQMRQDPMEFVESLCSRLWRRNRPDSLPRTIFYRPSSTSFWEFI